MEESEKRLKRKISESRRRDKLNKATKVILYKLYQKRQERDMDRVLRDYFAYEQGLNSLKMGLEVDG